MRRIEAGAGEFEDAAELEIIADDLSEEGRVRFGGIGAGSEVGNGDARLGLAEAGAGTKPWRLGRSEAAAQKKHSN